jgi:hypothetical protein
MALIRGTGASGGQNKKKKKKKLTSRDQHVQGRGGVAPANLTSPPKPKATPAPLKAAAPAPVHHPFVENIKNAHEAYTEINGKAPDAGQMYAMLNAAPQTLKKRDWSNLLSVLKGPTDPVTNATMKTSVEYFKKFKTYPSAEKMKALLDADKATGGMGVASVLPASSPYIPPDSSDLSVFDILSKGSQDKSDRRITRPGGKWTKADLAIGDGPKTAKEADAMRELANRPQHALGKTWTGEAYKDVAGGDRITNADLDRINQARSWYGLTELKLNITNKQIDRSGTSIVNPDGTDNVEAVKFLKSLTGTPSSGRMDDPHTFVGIRQSTYGKPVDKLSKARLEDLNLFGARLSQLFPQFTVPKSGQYVWNDQMDKWANTYMFYSSIGDAARQNPYKEKNSDGSENPRWKAEDNRRKAATANLSIATHGEIEPGDNIREWVQSMGFLGTDEDPASFSDSFTRFLFEDCYLRIVAPKNQAMTVSIYQYAAANGGPNSLPPEYRKQYDAVADNWAVTVAALSSSRDNPALNPIGVIFDSQLTALEEAQKAQIPVYDPNGTVSNDVYGVEDVTPEEMRARRKSDDSSTTVELPLNERGHIIIPVNKTQVGGKGGAGPVLKDIDPDDDFMMWVNYTMAPFVESAVSKVVNVIEREKNRIFLTLALMAEYGGGSHLHGRQLDPTQLLVNTAMRKYGPDVVKAATAMDPGDFTVPMSGNAYRWSNITRAWNEASDRVGITGNQAYIRNEFEQLGLDPETHGTLLFMSDLAWSIGVDVALDAGIGLVASGLKVPTATVVRKLSSPKIKQAMEVADEALTAKNTLENLTRATDVAGTRTLADDIIDLGRNAAKQEEAGNIDSAIRLRAKARELAENGEGALNPFQIRMVKEGKYAGQTAKSVGEQASINAARQAVINSPEYIAHNLAFRPMWFDTFADGLAKSTMEGWQVKRILGVSTEDVAGDVTRIVDGVETTMKRSADVTNLTKRIGATNDADEITMIMNELRVVHGIELDPGRLFLGRTKHWYNVKSGGTMGDWTDVIQSGDKIDGGAVATSEHLWKEAQHTNMGFQTYAEAQPLVHEFMGRLDSLPHNVPEVVLNRERQKIYDEFTAITRVNMEKRLLDPSKKKHLLQFAKANGLVVPEEIENKLVNEWQGYVAFRNIKNSKRTDLRLGGPETKKAWYHEIQSDTPYVPEGAKSTGQRSRNLTTPYNVSDLISYQRNKPFRQMLMYTNWFGRTPSYMGVVNATRTLAVASMSFPISALFIDEFYRFIPEILRGEMDVSMLVRARAMTAERGLRAAAKDAVDDMLGITNDVTPILPSNDRVYTKFLNRHLRNLRQTDIFGEFVHFYDALGEETVNVLGEQAVRDMFAQHLTEMVMKPNDEAAAALRRFMQDTKRGFEGRPREYQDVLDSQNAYLSNTERVEQQFDTVAAQRDDVVSRIHSFLNQEVEVPTRGMVDVEVDFPQSKLDEIEKLKSDISAIRNRPAPDVVDPELAQMQIDFIEKTFADPKYDGERRAQLEEALQKAKDSLAASPAPKVTTPDFPEIPEPMVTPEHMASAEYADETNEWLLQNVEGLKYNKKTGVWNTKAYQREQAGYDTHIEFHNAGEEYEDDIDIIEQLLDENIEDMRVEWMQNHGDEISSVLPDGWTMEQADIFVHKVELDTGEKYEFHLMYNDDSGKWGLSEYDSRRDRLTSIRGKFDSLDEGIRYFELRKAEDEAVHAAARESETAASPELAALEAKLADLEGTPSTESVGKTRKVTMQTALHVDRPSNTQWIYGWLKSHGFLEEASADLDTKLLASFGDSKKVREALLGGFMRMRKEFTIADYNQMYRQYKFETWERRGISAQSQERGRLATELKETRARLNEAKAERSAHYKTGFPQLAELDTRAKEWLGANLDDLMLLTKDKSLWAKATGGKKLHKAPLLPGDVNRIRKNLQSQGLDLPQVIGVKGTGSGWIASKGQVGHLPIISKLAELGPYKMLNAMGNLTRKAAFLGNFTVEYKKLLALGWKEADALEAAERRALKYVDKVMYSPGMTAKEKDLAGVAYFLPAFRQAIMYWGKEFMKNPLVYNNIRNNIMNEMPMAYGPRGTWMGDYGAYMVMPFWATSSLLEGSIPGLTTPILLPLRAINSWSGWSNVQTAGTGTPDDKSDDEWEWQYTGATKLDFLSGSAWLNPLTGFASKNVSPLSWIDDLLYGIWGDDSYSLAASNDAMRLVYSIGLAFRKDPITRRKATWNIMQSQMAKGYAPNTSEFQKNLKGSPFWYSFLAGALGADNPEAILSAFTRQLLPRRIAYSPSDVGIVTSPSGGTGTGNFWDIADPLDMFGDGDARTIADAEYEFIQASGNAAKQKAILEKYPKLGLIHDFRKMDALDKEQYLMVESNAWIVPYIGGKNEYSDATGSPLTAAEYRYQVEIGSIRRKETDDWLRGLGGTYANAAWSRRKAIIDTKYKSDKAAAHKWAMDVIEHGATNPITKAAWLKKLAGYEKWAWGDLAPTFDKDAQHSAPFFLKQAAIAKWGEDHYLKHQSRWDPQAIKTSYEEQISANGEKGGERALPEYQGAKEGGVAEFYTGFDVNQFSREEGVGRMKRIYDAFNDTLMPDDRELFSPKTSISYGAIQKKLRENEKFRQYDLMSIIETPYYNLDSAAQLESAMPGIFDPRDKRYIGCSEQDMDKWFEAQSNAYGEYKSATTQQGVSEYYGDKYDAAKKVYDKKVAALMKMPAATPFVLGVAGRYLNSYLTDPKDQKVWSREYSSKVVTELKDKPDIESLVDGFHAGKTKRPLDSEAANAWASICNAAIALQKTVEHQRTAHKDDGHIGDATNAATRKLWNYVGHWKKRSRKFRAVWDDMGGDILINSLLTGQG